MPESDDAPAIGLTDADRDRLAELATADLRERDWLTLTYEACGDEFDVRPSERDRRFCSRECFRAARSERVALTCEACGDEFDVRPSERDQRFCTAACSHGAGYGGRPPLDATEEGGD